ncbi:MAG: hypothetical protein IK075_11020, partial [Prevotella sp.]|nr:hypothetical protein [Prevotella sp.]
ETGEGITHIYLSGYTYDPNVVPVDWDATTKQGSFAMPGADVELEAEYYDDATVTGTATAAAGVRAGDDKALVGGLTASGGTLVWAVTANNVTTAPADADFAEGNNTAKGLTAEGTYRVWYFAAGDSEHSPSEPTYTDVTVAAALFEGAGTEESPYLVNTYEDLKKFSALVNDGTLNGAGIYFRLDADIDCTGMTDFVPIGTASHPFKGKFDGNSKTISGLEFIINDSYSSDPAGLFGELNHENGMIKDLTLSGCTFKGGDMTGAIVTELLNGTIQNCEVNSCIIETGNEFTFPYCGGIAGYIQKGVISNCTVNGGTITASSTYDSTGSSYAGGIVGYLYDGNNISGCEVKGNVTITSSHAAATSSLFAGAIIGYISGTPSIDRTSSNYYYSTVTTSTKKVNETAVEKSGQTERGIGNADDVIGQVELAGTKKVTIYVPDAIGNGGCMAVDGTYYKFVSPNYYVLPGSDFTYSMKPTNGYKPTFTLSDNTIEVTANEVEVDGAYDHTEFTFTMPDEDLQGTLSFPPAAPTIAFDEEKSYVDTDEITITGAGGATIFFTWSDAAIGTEYTHDTDNPTLTVYDNSDKPTARKGTLRAWAGILVDAGENKYMMSEAASQAFTAKTDIENCIFDDEYEVTVHYTGSAYVPSVKVYDKYDNEKTLTEGTDYTVAYYEYVNDIAGDTPVDMIEVGSYQMVISGKGDYFGSKSVDIDITKAYLSDVEIEAISDQTYTGSEIKPEIKVTLAGNVIAADGNFTITYSQNTNVTTETVKATVTLTATEESKCFERSINESTRKTATFNITPKSIAGATITLSGDGFDSEKNSFVYNGQNQKPTVTVKDGETLLTLDTDYALTNEGGKDVGEYTVIVMGKGNYDSNTTVSKTFTIGKANAVLSFDKATASITFGKESEFEKPKLTTTPEGLTVKYESEKTDIATIDETTGDITPVAAGETEIKATFEGSTNYNSASASYTLTVVKGTPTGIHEAVTDKGQWTTNWYDLQGRQIDQPTKKGFYILNGKKVVIK